MQNKNKSYSGVIIAFMALSIFLLAITMLMPMANAAGAITLNPNGGSSGSSISVAGTGFGATKAVGIGFGAEKTGSNSDMAYTGTSDGLTWSGRISNYPIKPGSFTFYSDTGTSGMVSTYTDNGDGTTTGSFAGAVGTINYATGQWSRTTTVDVTGIAANYSATYTYYNNSVTPVAGVTTSASGSFTTNITIPSVAAGNYNVNVIDAQGNRASQLFSVSTPIPETLTIGIVVILSTFATLVSYKYFQKQPKIQRYN